MVDPLEQSSRSSAHINPALVYTFLIESSFVIIFNILIFASIVFNRKRRSQRHYCLLTGSTVFEVLFAATYFTFAVHFLYLRIHYHSGIPYVSRWECLLKIQDLLLLFITPEAGILSLSFTIDRFISVFFPVKYLLFPIYYLPLLFTCSFVAVTPAYVLSFVENYGTRNIDEVSAACTLSDAVSPLLFKALRYTRIITTMLGVLLYIPIAVQITRIVKRANQHMPLSSVEWRKLCQMTLSIGLITFNQLIFFTLPDLYLLLEPNGRHDVVYILNLNKGVINVFVVVLTQKELRDFFLRNIKKKSYRINTVQTVK